MTARKFTNQLHDLMVEGQVDPMWLAGALMSYMSERDIQDFCETELDGFFEQDEDTADEYDDAGEYDEGAEFYGA
jgi:hypothetical protein